MSMEKGPMRVAGVGAGFFSQFHYDAWARIADVVLVGVCDQDQAKARGAQHAYGIAAIFDDLDTMIREVRPDLIDIITPPQTHLDLVSRGASAGIPMICQKPLAPTLPEAIEVVEVAEAADVPLIVHENFRWQPWYREIKGIMDGGTLGTVHNATFRLRPGDGQGATAYLDRQPYFQSMPRFLIHETGIHVIDVFRYLFGEPDAVYAELRTLNPAISGEDAGLVVLNFPGLSAVFDGNRLIDHSAANPRLVMGEMLVEGTEGALRVDGDGRVFVRRRGGQEQEHAYRWHDRGFGGDCVHALYQHVVDVFRGTAAPINTARAYLANLRIEEAVYQSAESGRRIALR